ncbi:hypothetical protein DXG03_001903 [Asterophora parasitica]|uniref:DUF7918 domain-containing protein n=1 Tax=Asterophora parasitica TaxID=117018 RepID=A0A9P7K8Y7_9AGAR|nr:hypothetical protein DXG03_001903 [Asterophora parasitica]
MQFLEFEAFVTVDDKELPEYEIKFDDVAKTATCWIPSEADKSFAITSRALTQQPYDIVIRHMVDGIRIGGFVIGKIEDQTAVCSREHVVISSTTRRRLMFAPIQLTDDDAYLDNSIKLKALGEIVVSITRVDITGEVTPSTKTLSTADEKLHEKSKKAMKHRVKFGEEEGYSTQRVRTVRNICTLATFIFRRFFSDVLRADGIAPPEPESHNPGKRKASEAGDDESGEESDDDSGLDEKDEAELKALLARVSKIQSKMAKKGSVGSKAPAAKKVKREPKAPVFLPGEVIDLT